MSSPEICIVKTDGINCEVEMQNAFELTGAKPEVIHVNLLKDGTDHLSRFSGLVIPGGFSYGDDIGSGNVLANESRSRMSDQLQEFADAGKPILGVCNGMQVLVKTGLLPNRTLSQQQATMAENIIGHFDRRWIELLVGNSVCKFAKPDDFGELTIPMEIAHGEGRFITSQDQLHELHQNGQVVFRYAQSDDVAEPYNPNGSMDDIAGICDPTGLILGMMPHPERSIASMHPNRERTEAAHNAATIIFNNIVNYAKEM